MRKGTESDEKGRGRDITPPLRRVFHNTRRGAVMNTVRPKVIWIVRYDSERGARTEREGGKGDLGKKTRGLRMKTMEIGEEVRAIFEET